MVDSGAEERGEHKVLHEHRQQRIEETPEDAEDTLPILCIKIAADKLFDEEAVAADVGLQAQQMVLPSGGGAACGEQAFPDAEQHQNRRENPVVQHRAGGARAGEADAQLIATAHAQSRERVAGKGKHKFVRIHGFKREGQIFADGTVGQQGGLRENR